MDPEYVLEVIPKKDEEEITREDYMEIEIPYDFYQYLSSEDCNIQNMCRICLSTDNDILYPLVTTKESNVLAHMLTAFTSVQLLPGDGLPSSICEPCQAQVMQCYEFKIKCEKSDCMLKSILKGEFIPKEELPDHSMVVKQEENLENNEDNNIDKNVYFNDNFNVKNEMDLLEEVQYLEELSDNSGNQCVENTWSKKKKKFADNELKSTKSKSQLKDSNKKLKRKCGNKANSFRCKICSKVFRNAKSFHGHVKNKHPSAKHQHMCNQCSESFISEHDLKVHSSIHIKGSSWKCNQCPKEFSARPMLRRHILRHMESKRHSCDACGKAFSELYALRRHARVHTGELVEKKHACTLCDKRYSESGLLAAHMSSSHIGLRPYECSVCSKRFTTNRLLASHRLVHTDRKPYACQYCDKRFRHESTRNTHHRTHTGEKPYVCAVCGKSFIQNSNHTQHMRTHTGERPYSCSICERKFSSGSSLKSHERIHSGERPYSCDICGRRFTRKNLIAHMRQHTGERPFECSVCNKKFPNATRLRDHHRVHTGEKPFECAVCNLKFATKSQLLKHSKTHQTKKKRTENRALVILQHIEPVSVITDRIMFNKEHGELITVNENVAADKTLENASTLNMVQEMPLEVTEELVLQDDSDMKGNLLVVDGTSSNNYQGGNICLNTSNVNIIDNLNYDGDNMNLVTLNEGGVSISTSNLEGTTVKLFQLNQSLVQINSSGGQVTISKSKISSKMTANF